MTVSYKDRHFGREIKKADNCIYRMSTLENKSDDEEDITESNRWLIMYLYDHREDNVFQKDIEEEFSVRRSTSSNIISLMEKKGLVERVSVDYDARLKKLVLTPKALEQCGRISRELESFEKKLTNGISEEELEIFYKVLDKAMDNIKQYAG